MFAFADFGCPTGRGFFFPIRRRFGPAINATRVEIKNEPELRTVFGVVARIIRLMFLRS